MYRIAAIVAVVGSLHQTGGAMQLDDSAGSLSQYFTFDDPAPLSCLFIYFPPFFIQHGIELKSFIRSRVFHEIRGRYGDKRAVDAIYIRAMQMTNNNTAMALLLATLASFDHQSVGIKIPVLNLFFPLTNESEREFNRRVNNLPSKLYDDTPDATEGDRDKIQHFLGSAFLTYAFESREAAMRIGEFVEEGEDAFIVGGVLDERDRRANKQGQDFGIALFDDNHHVPSEFLKNGVVATKRQENRSIGVNASCCPGVW